MKDRIGLISYAAGVLVVTFVHSIPVLSAMLVVLLLLSAKRARVLARRTILAILFFNSIVTLSYIAMGIVRDELSAGFILLFNCRVFLLTYMTFLLADLTNPLRALAFSRTLCFLGTLAVSQVFTFRRLLDDFRSALASRAPKRLSPGLIYRHRATVASFFIRKALVDSEEITGAMTSRGFFDV